jgi:hypothetical protein
MKAWCARLVEKQDDDVARIPDAAGTIWEMLGIFQRVQRNMQ